ncbi:hypothetical protein VPHK165_0097 [Vibrio phage K165]
MFHNIMLQCYFLYNPDRKNPARGRVVEMTN